MRFGSRISTNGAKCAYLDGGAYLLDSRFRFAGDFDAETEVRGAISASSGKDCLMPFLLFRAGEASPLGRFEFDGAAARPS